jgi:hypothetical protein
MNEKKLNELKRIDELKSIIKENIAKDLEFNNKLNSLVKSYKRHSHEIFELINSKFNENSNEITELWFLETFKDIAYVDDIKF